MAKRNLSSVRYPLFFAGIFLIELGGLLFHFLKIPIVDVAVFAALGFLIYFLSIAVPWS